MFFSHLLLSDQDNWQGGSRDGIKWPNSDHHCKRWKRLHRWLVLRTKQLSTRGYFHNRRLQWIYHAPKSISFFNNIKKILNSEIKMKLLKFVCTYLYKIWSRRPFYYLTSICILLRRLTIKLDYKIGCRLMWSYIMLSFG